MKIKSKTKICTHCGYIGEPVAEAKSSLLFDVFIWVVFAVLSVMLGVKYILVIPLIWSVYHIVRFKTVACPRCMNLKMVPLTSEKGQIAVQEHSRPISTFL